MKAVVVHKHAFQVERDWATQFAGLDRDVKNQFATVVDWQERYPKVFEIKDLTWKDIVDTISEAAKFAGPDGVVAVASGHGGSVNDDVGIINWDATEPPGFTITRDWKPGAGKGGVGKGLFWDETVSRYTDFRTQQSMPPTWKEEDEDKIKKKVQGFQVLQMRHDAYEALVWIGAALQTNKVKRLTFTTCTAGRSPNFLTRIAKHCHAQVAFFKFKTIVFDDSKFPKTTPPPFKARLVLESDWVTDGQGTNTMRARVLSPDLDDMSIAFVAKP